MPSHFCQALQIPSIMAMGRRLHGSELEIFEEFDDDVDLSQEEEPDDDDDEGVEKAMSTEWTPGDVVGKILAFVAQVCRRFGSCYMSLLILVSFISRSVNVTLRWTISSHYATSTAAKLFKLQHGSEHVGAVWPGVSSV
jgi:hypothetical protein